MPPPLPPPDIRIPPFIKGMTIVISKGWGGGRMRDMYLAVTADGQVASLQVENLGDRYFAVHIQCGREHRRKGYTSALMDFAIREQASYGRAPLFEDEQLYYDLKGMGSFTHDGQVWADAYRESRHIELPPTVVAYFCGPLVPREGVTL